METPLHNFGPFFPKINSIFGIFCISVVSQGGVCHATQQSGVITDGFNSHHQEVKDLVLVMVLLLVGDGVVVGTGAGDGVVAKIPEQIYDRPVYR